MRTLTAMSDTRPQPQKSSSGYQPIPGAYDELLDSLGNPREKYKFLLNSYAEIGADEMAGRRKELARLLKDDGVTYNVYGHGDEKERLWSLDLMPFLMESTEFGVLERGLIQRGELLNAIFKDIYGSRRLIYDRIVPGEVIFAAQAYLRQCYGFYASRQRELIFFSSDIARRADGTFVVIGDRAQAPSGTGYALENRIALSRVFPSLYRDSEVHRVAIFFRTLRKTLASLAKPVSGRDPLIVLLTPGQGNETYFEHVYLAGYLGYTLAQATDLTVRANRVYIKTVEGHQQVDVIFRRTDDAFMDPLELRGDSLLGIPGIVEAIRNGNVAVVSPLGSAVLENRSLMAYFPVLAKYYFGEDLILPNTETYYLGDPAHRSAVLADFDRYIIKPSQRGTESQHLYPARLSQADKAELRQKITLHGNNFVAQEIIPGSSVPVYDNENRMLAAKCVIRTFQVASESGYQVMPGGLARVSTRVGELIVTNQTGAGSKDVWILASEPQKDVSLLRQTIQRTRISRKATGSVPSRIADNIFWMARYAERTENLSRLIRNVITKITQSEDFTSPDDVKKLLKMLTHVTGEYPGFVGDDSAELMERPEQELSRLIYDGALAGSVRHSILSLIRTSESLRDNLSDDMRRVISELELSPYVSTAYSAQHAHLFDVIIHLSAISGLSQESMSREVGWYFLELGRRIERAQFSLRVLKSFIALGNLYDKFVVENLLNINDIRITYTRRYRHRIEVDSVLDILLFDETNPRSLGHQLTRIKDTVARLPAAREGMPSSGEKLALKLFTAYKTSDIREILAGDNPQQQFAGWLEELGGLLTNLGYNIAETYFTYVEEQYRIGDLNG